MHHQIIFWTIAVVVFLGLALFVWRDDRRARARRGKPDAYVCKLAANREFEEQQRRNFFA